MTEPATGRQRNRAEKAFDAACSPDDIARLVAAIDLPDAEKRRLLEAYASGVQAATTEAVVEAVEAVLAKRQAAGIAHEPAAAPVHIRLAAARDSAEPSVRRIVRDKAGRIAAVIDESTES